MAPAVCVPADKMFYDDDRPVHTSSRLLSQKSLDVCTETPCSDSGSDGFLSDEEMFITASPPPAPPPYLGRRTVVSAPRHDTKELISVNYHCSGGARSFPPPLPSLSRRDGMCIRVRARRRGGRLVVEAVPAPSKNYFHAQRRDGRLRLSFVECAARKASDQDEFLSRQEPPAAMDELVEEEVEVVDRGTVVEVKVSTQPVLFTGGGAAAMKVHRSSLVINKFVGGAPITVAGGEDDARVPLRRISSTATTTVAALAAAAASIAAHAETDGDDDSHDDKLLWRVRRCSELRRPIFIWEPYCIATS